MSTLDLDPSEILTAALLKAAKNLDLSQVQLAKILNTSGSTVSRLVNGKTKLETGRSLGDSATVFLLIYRLLGSIVGNNVEQMKAWLRSNNHDLGEVPLSLMEKQAGLYQVRIYLDAYCNRC